MPRRELFLAEESQLTVGEPLDHRSVGHKFVVFVDMHDRYVCLVQRLADEFGTMALFGPAFTAHEDDAPLLGERVLEAGDAGLEKRLGAHALVVHLAVYIAGWVVGPPAQGVAHVEVAEPMLAQGRLQRVFGKFRPVARIGGRAHVDEVFDRVGLQHGNEARQGAGAVADGIDWVRGRGGLWRINWRHGSDSTVKGEDHIFPLPLSRATSCCATPIPLANLY